MVPRAGKNACQTVGIALFFIACGILVSANIPIYWQSRKILVKSIRFLKIPSNSLRLYDLEMVSAQTFKP